MMNVYISVINKMEMEMIGNAVEEKLKQLQLHMILNKLSIPNHIGHMKLFMDLNHLHQYRTLNYFNVQFHSHKRKLDRMNINRKKIIDIMKQ